MVARQRSLASRLESLKDKDAGDDPRLKARMRDLEDEQRELREELAELLDDIDDHITRLPDDPKFDDLATTAREFVDAVRASGADTAMTEGETGLAEFSGRVATE